jgi:hypothetical protein
MNSTWQIGAASQDKLNKSCDWLIECFCNGGRNSSVMFTVSFPSAIHSRFPIETLATILSKLWQLVTRPTISSHAPSSCFDYHFSSYPTVQVKARRVMDTSHGVGLFEAYFYLFRDSWLALTEEVVTLMRLG